MGPEQKTFGLDSRAPVIWEGFPLYTFGSVIHPKIYLMLMFEYFLLMWLTTMPATKRSAGFTPEVNLGIFIYMITNSANPLWNFVIVYMKDTLGKSVVEFCHRVYERHTRYTLIDWIRSHLFCLTGYFVCSNALEWLTLPIYHSSHGKLLLFHEIKINSSVSSGWMRNMASLPPESSTDWSH